MPDFYRAPLGLPLYWRDEVSGLLKETVEAYLDNRVDGKPITEAEIVLLRDYFAHWINAPCWSPADSPFLEEIATLREEVLELKTAGEISEWIFKAMDIGIDPL